MALHPWTLALEWRGAFFYAVAIVPDERRLGTRSYHLMAGGSQEDQEPTWTCPQCKEHVPVSLEVCWNCGTTAEGIIDPGFVREQPADREEPNPLREVDRPSGFRCSKCGSTKLIPNVKILDQGEGSDGKLQVEVHGHPEALLFKDRRYGILTADICGDCGDVQLKVNNPQELYQHYLQSRE
jgi:hypothetical protein